MPSDLACLNRFFRPRVIVQSLPTVRGRRCSKLSKHICSLKKFAKCVALVGENTFPLSVSIWFFLPVCACV